MAIITSDGWKFEVNAQYVTLDTELLVFFSATAVAAGWVLLGASDGTTLVTDGTPNTSTQWNNSNAYEYWRDPSALGVGRQMIVIHGPTTRDVKAYVSKAGTQFTGATGAAPPTAVDQAQMIGTGGGFDTNYLVAAAGGRNHYGFNTVPQGTTGDVYAFFWIQRSTTSIADSRLIIEPVNTPANGVVGDADVEPYIGFWGSTSTPSSSGVTGWYKAGLTGQQVPPTSLVFAVETNRSGLSGYTGAYDLHTPIWYDAVPFQNKGTPVNMTYEFAGHADADTYDLATESKARCIWGSFTVRWPVGVAPLA